MNNIREIVIKMKKIMALLLSTLMVLGFTACSSQNTQNSQNHQNSALATQLTGKSVAEENVPIREQINETEIDEDIIEASTSISEQVSAITEEETDILTDSSTEKTSEFSQDEYEIGDITDSENEGGKTLVVYYSATGTTENVANNIAVAADANLFKLEPVNPYSSDDLNWRNENSRVVYEHDNPDARVVELVAATVENWESYDTVFIGYPIWWRIAAWPVDGFIIANDFTGKTVIPFCTSSNSDLGESGELLAEVAGTGNWLEGQRFSSEDSTETIQAWVESLRLD